MFETLKKAFKVKEIRHKIWWTLLFLFVYRIGCYIPVPGVGEHLLSSSVNSSTSYLQIMNMMTGGALANGTLFAMGIGPYINSSIIIQLLAVAIPPLENRQLYEISDLAPCNCTIYRYFGELRSGIYELRRTCFAFGNFVGRHG